MRTNSIPSPHFSYCSPRRRRSCRQVPLAGLAEALSCELRDKDRDRTANAYITAANGLTDFTGNENLLLSDITPALLIRYDNYLIQLGRELNTVSFHLRNLRAIYNKAVFLGLIPPPQENIFAGLHTGVYPTQKRALDTDEMRALAKLSIDLLEDSEVSPAEGEPESPPKLTLLQCAILYFLFCFHARGMSFIDMAFLRKENIHGDSILYCRRKTKKMMPVKITAPMQSIIDRFAHTVTDSPYLFPIIDPARGNERRQYATALALQNKLLKIISRMAGIDKVISTHVARHSWATLAKRKNVPLAVISEGLGHRDERTTAIYLDSFETSVLDEVSELISSEIC
jgi:integrase